MNYASEIITVDAGINYSPTFVRTDRRRSSSELTSLGYMQIGELAQYGNAKGPIFKLEFVDLSGIATATHVKIWGLLNDDTNAPLYPITYFSTFPSIEIFAKKFIFCDNAGVEVDETGNYLVIGHKKNVMPISY
jgi:hypothetical protein